jgi:tRNA threonylcarbamoyladenosine biosynthesis protein TsaB
MGAVRFTGKITHSRRLLPLIAGLMEETETSWYDIGAICVSLGPGSFTGLRIGMATAKGLALAAGKPMIGVSTLDGFASGCGPAPFICAVMDARKKEVYASFYRTDSTGLTVAEGMPMVISPHALIDHFREPVLLVGDALSVYDDIWRSCPSRVTFAPAHLNTPMAESLGFLAGEKMIAGDVLDSSGITPLYVRASDAELNLIKKQRNTAQLQADIHGSGCE